MSIKSLTTVVGFALCFSPLFAVADEAKTCNTTQQERCGQFCQAHQGMQSCMIDITARSGTCSCVDGASHTKS